MKFIFVKMLSSHFFKNIIALASIVLLGASCATKVELSDATLCYATLLTMQEEDSFTVARIADPWHKNQLLATYVLVPDSLPLPHQLPQGTVVRTPLKRAIVTSSVHAALLLDFDATKRMAGITDVNYIVSQPLKDYLLTHPEVKNVGSALNPNVEVLKATNTDGILISPFENDENGSLRAMGFNLIACADYMETSPLGRAEWMRFYGHLFGAQQRADSLFKAIETRYQKIKQSVKNNGANRPTVFCDLKMGNTWYEPGGASTMGQFIADAGGHYLWTDRKESGSLPLDLESVYARAHQADIWLVKYGQATDLTYQQMQNDCAQYAQFAAWKHHNVWVCNTFKIPFFEEVPFHPDRLLQNLVEVFKTAKVSDGANNNRYYTPLSK